MADTAWSSAAHNALRWIIWLLTFGIAALTGAVGVAAPRAWAQDVSFSAAVDKTTASVGEPIQLVITLSGNTAGIRLPRELPLPEGFVVLAQSQSTNFSIQAGAVARSVALTYVVAGQQAGTFKLGPFEAAHGDQPIATEPIEITVKKAVEVPKFRSEGPRYSL